MLFNKDKSFCTSFKPPFKIVHKTGWLAACDLYRLDQVKNWLDKFNPDMWEDKTLKVNDFIVLNRDGVRVG